MQFVLELLQVPKLGTAVRSRRFAEVVTGELHQIIARRYRCAPAWRTDAQVGKIEIGYRFGGERNGSTRKAQTAPNGQFHDR